MYRCFTLDNLNINPGIDPGEFDCLIPSEDGGQFIIADVKLLPVLPYIKPSLETAHLSLAFVKQAPSTSEPKRGSLVSINPADWNICCVNSSMMLLDPCGCHGNMLLFLPPSLDNILSYRHTVNGTFVVRTDTDGIPSTHTKSTGLLMLESLGIGLTEMFPEPSRAALSGGSKPPKAPCRKTAKAALLRKA